MIGGGHSGLVSEAPWGDAPHLRVTRLSYVMSLKPPTIVTELELDRHGYKVHPLGLVLPGVPRGWIADHL